ncbi:MAG TPA: S9 family peptidase [Verrucomicrobiales bacterium]|nr:S9 family peptidase [Verrucomicrobiales bacterium]
MKIVSLLLALLASAWLTTPVSVAANKRLITPHDLWAMKRLGSPALSPDGSMAVFTVTEWSIEKNKSTTHLWVVDLAGGVPWRLTSAPNATDASPRWSPDGGRIAFTSKRGEDESSALYVMSIDGGEPEKILELPYAITSPRWMPGGDSLVVATSVIPELAGTLDDDGLAAMRKEIKRRKDSKITAKATEDRQFRFWDQWLTDGLAHRLLLVDLASREFTDLTPGFDRMFVTVGQTAPEVRFDVAPDGGNIAVTMNSTPPPYDDVPNHDIYLIPTDGSGALKNLTSENPGADGGAVFAPDGRSFVFTRTKSPYYNGEFAKLFRHDLTTGENLSLTEALDYAIGSAAFSPDSRTLWLTAEDKGSLPVFKMNGDGADFASVFRQGTSSGLDAAGGAAVFLNNTAGRPDELFALDPATGTARQITHFNADLLVQLDLGSAEEYWFDGAGGDRVQGFLFLPPSFDAAKSYPLLQLMHGGPHTMAGDAWSYRWNAHVFAATGHVTTWVNRHGSTGFGQSFSQSILNAWGDKPLEDILKATDFLLARFSNIDPKRLAAAGGSYGGYMAAWAAGHTDRFACLINHAGVNDFITQYGADVTSYSFAQVLGGAPWDNPEGMQRNNPMSYAKNFQTPMLIIHGQLDYRVPYANGTALYGVYRAMGLPARLIIFPDENHWILTPQNSIYWNWEFQRWLARWTGGTPTLAKPEFNTEDS